MTPQPNAPGQAASSLLDRLETVDVPRSWSEAPTSYPREKTVAQIFEEVAAANPGAIALECDGRQLTYSELNARANQLAHRLTRMGVGLETMVGCCIERSPELIVAFLGILKAGGAYVPLDPAYPKERFDFLLEDTRTPLMITQKHMIATVLSGRSLPVLCVDELENSAFPRDRENPASTSGPTSLAYVMYTSGSTGTPRGALIENRSIVRLVRNTNFCRFGPDEVFLQLAPISFDASTLEIWGPLLNGGRLVIMPPAAPSLQDIGDALRKYGVTTLWLTAGLFNLMVDERLEDLRPLRQLLAGGDVLSARHIRKVLERLPECTLINGYGPTENTTFTCCHVMRHGDPVPASVPIGRPIANTRVYILDEQLAPVRAGQAGELYAAGDGVARGYLNNPSETAKKFSPDPFAPEPGARMYRTGDLARWRNDGVIEFFGRLDNQVKILGHRIELGEIEAVLQMHGAITQACVVAHSEGDGPKRLVAYYVSPENAPLASDLRKFLAGKVPQQMVPAAFIPLPALPLSPNGKVDRSALPQPTFLLAPSEGPLEERATDLEQAIVDVWKRILRVERVNLNDNFFDLGGDSLLLIAVHSNLQKLLHIEMPVTDLFEFTTVRTLAGHLGKKEQAKPEFSEARSQAQKQRDAFARQRQRRTGGEA